MKYDRYFNTPTIKLLTEYYRITLNPDLEFDKDLLEQLGFKRCYKCYDDVPPIKV